ncbi:hypothetical protein [Haloparvum sedimenti]|uniref:hypothetical protein n=1 Tax=Haloparvum sedimenti TaxID=1678448 RepID=UPI00071E9051|nr:hypothetical protein [Haloparvum sedimenti]
MTGVDPPSRDELFESPAAPEELAIDPSELDREWVLAEAAAVFSLTPAEAEAWVAADGVGVVYARIQAYWDAI